MSDSPREKFPPGPPPNLIRSLFGAMQQNPLDYFTDMAQKYGDVSGMRIGNFRSLFINHPDLIEDVLVKDARKYHKGRILQANKFLFGDGLLTSEGDFWLRQRRLAQPAFHRARVSTYAATMAEYAEQMAATWRGGEERDIHDEMMQLALRIVGKTLFDADVTRDAKEVGETLDILLRIAANFGRTILVPMWVPSPRNIRAKLGIRRLEKVIYRIIAERRASGHDAGDLLSILLQAQDDDGTHMNDRQLRDETITLFLAGHETTANTLSWTWMLLAQNPAVEKKFHEELDGVLGGRAPTLDDLQKLTYLNHVLTESLRLFPTAWGMARLAAEEHEIAGYPVRVGYGVAFAQWVVHRDARWFDAPLEFRPERWENGLAKKLPRFAYFPFGGGPRQCIGNTFALMEASVVLATIGQKYRFELVPGHKVTPLASITLRPRDGIRVRLEAR
ncbi:MAG TPA: cytochrome P450 [Candidatus Acidoferrum sp.]